MLTVFCCDLWQSELQCQICIRIGDFDVAPVYVCRRAERQFQLRWLACVRDRMHGLADDSRSQHVFMAVHAPDSYKLRDATNVRSGYVAAVLAVRASPSVTVKLWPCGCLQSGLCLTWICRHGRSFPSMGLWLLRMIIAWLWHRTSWLCACKLLQWWRRTSISLLIVFLCYSWWLAFGQGAPQS